MNRPPLRFDRFRSLRTEPREYFRTLLKGHRARGDFRQVRAFCLFLGTPRSGHSLIGAMLNAHRNAVIAGGLDILRPTADGLRRNQLYWSILRHDRKFTLEKASVEAGYSFAIPGQWQGRFESLEVIGSKRGGAASRALATDPSLLARLEQRVGVPLRIIHTVRHPYDNIATISRRHEMSLPEAADFYFGMCSASDRVLRDLDETTFRTVHHEDFVAAPARGLTGLCSFLGLAPYPGYVEDCSKLVWSSARESRGNVEWPGSVRVEIAQRAREFPFLAAYSYD